MKELLDFSTFSPEQISQWVKQHHGDKLRTHIAQMSPEQIGIAIHTINKSSDWKNKLYDIINNLKDVHQLESAGKSIDAEQLLEILERSREWEANTLQTKLQSLFVGIPQQVFAEMLIKASPAHLEILKQGSMSEPIQHHLILFIHQMTAELNHDAEILSGLEDEIHKLDPIEMTQADTQAIKKKIEDIHLLYFSALNKTKKALSIAWNTNRSELVEKLSLLKEKSQKVCQYILGVPGISRIPSSGLYSVLEARLNAVYGDPTNPAAINALKDDEPAIEALVKFSIWYLKDYWEIGLLPSIDLDQLDLDPALHDESERMSHREKLFTAVDQNLQKLGLLTVKDLKNAEIYSKKSLIEYINANRDSFID